MNQQTIINSLPRHLQPFVAIQDYESYSPRDHAIWRFLLKQLSFSLKDSAHPTYFEGLAKTGLGFEAIPKIEDVNACLNELGWRAVAVDGFLPPAVFMEFQAQRVLAIALNIRSFENMLYTPAPDIVHEAAGHAPFLIDIDYAEFLQRFGELGMRAINNQHDLDIYEAVRELSIVKEQPDSSAEQIAIAQKNVEDLQNKKVEPSEANLLARLHWWTVEYGLVGETDDYTIFGAGLLSSLSESASCMNDSSVPKQPLSLNAIRTAYDITTAQPQLFVTQSCRHLSQVLEEYGRHMCCSRGGASALLEALDAASIVTSQYNSGLQVAGRLNRVLCDAIGNAIYLGTQGNTQLAYQSQQLPGHGIDYHAEGFGSPIGRLRSMERCLSAYTVDELKRHNIEIGQQVILNFLSGVQVTGQLRHILRRDQRNILFSFDNCTVVDIDGNILFDPAWGNYDMAVGDEIVAVYGGSADQTNFPLYESPSNKITVQQEHHQSVLAQFDLYQSLNDDPGNLTLMQLISDDMSLDWLLKYEALEHCKDQTLKSTLKSQLSDIAAQSDSDTKQLINGGLARLDQAITS